MPSTGGTDAATSIWNHSAKFTGNSILSPASSLQINVQICLLLFLVLAQAQWRHFGWERKQAWFVSNCSEVYTSSWVALLKPFYFIIDVQKQINHCLGDHPQSIKRAFEFSKGIFWLCKTDVTLWPYIANSLKRTYWIGTKLCSYDDQMNSAASLYLQQKSGQMNRKRKGSSSSQFFLLNRCSWEET